MFGRRKLAKLKPAERQHPYLGPVASNPYFTARLQRQDRQLKILAAGKLWRNIAVLALISNMALASGMVAMTRMRKETPFVLAVDKWGYTVPVGRGTPATLDTYTQYHLKDFIRAARSVSIDTFALEKSINRAYTFVKKPSAAFNFLSEYHTELQKPFEKARQLSVYVENISLIRISDYTFRARWSEVSRAMSGHVLSRDQFWGEFTYRLHSPSRQDPAERDSNPLALKIEQITWAKE